MKMKNYAGFVLALLFVFAISFLMQPVSYAAGSSEARIKICQRQTDFSQRSAPDTNQSVGLV